MSKPPFGSPPSYNPYEQPQSLPPKNYSQYQAPHYPPVSPFAITSLVMGIISLATSCCACLGIPLGLVAIMCGIIGISQCNSGQYSGRGLAVAGTICGGLAVAIFVSLIILNAVLETTVAPRINPQNF